MRFYSAAREEFNRNIAARRQLFLQLHKFCWFNCWNPSQCVHEIGTRGNRKAFLDQPCSWAAACSECNTDKLTDYRLWPLVRQLAVKKREDPENYDLAAYLKLRGEGPAAITEGEVLLAMRALAALEEG